MDERKPIGKTYKILILVYAFLVFGILCAANADAINGFLGNVIGIFRPVINGLVIAYLCNPIFRFFERHALIFVRAPKLRRVLSLLLAFLTLAALVALLVLLILPQLIDSFMELAGRFDTYVSAAIRQFNSFIGSINGIIADLTGKENLISWIDEDLLHQKISGIYGEGNNNLMDYVQSIDLMGLVATIGNVFSIVTDFIFGLFVSIYLLYSKEKRFAQLKKLRHAILGEKLNAHLLRLVEIANDSFAGFLRGKALASLIVGVLFYTAATLLNLPYAILISTIMTVANMIPIIGPIIGAIPSALIVLLVAPEKILIFLILAILFQQLDTNIVSPKILGSNLGISPLCVMISITVMGALWGLAGMILGVPLFATVLAMTEQTVIERLRSRGLPAGLGNYYPAGATMGPAEQLKSRSTRLLAAYEKRLLRLHRKAIDRESSTYTKRELRFLRANAILSRIGFRLPDAPETYLQYCAELAAEKAAKRSEDEFCRLSEEPCPEADTADTAPAPLGKDA